MYNDYKIMITTWDNGKTKYMYYIYVTDLIKVGAWAALIKSSNFCLIWEMLIILYNSIC